MKPADLLQALIVVSLWGLNFIPSKISAAHVPPLFFTSVRFLITGLLVVPFVTMPRGRWGRMVLLSSVLGVAHFGLMLEGIRGLDIASAAIALQLCVPFSAALGAIFYRERMGWLGVGGLILAMGGVVLVAGAPQRPDPLFLGIIVAAAFFWAISNLLIKRLGEFDPLAMNGWIALLAAPQLLVLSVLFETNQLGDFRAGGWPVWTSMAYMILASSLVAYTLWYRLIARLSFDRVVPITLLNPVIGILAGVLLMGDPLDWRKGLGAMATLVGVAIIVLRPPLPSETSPP